MRKHVKAGTHLDDSKKVRRAVLDDLGEAGYWGLLVDQEYGGIGCSLRQLRRVPDPDGHGRCDGRRPGLGPRLHRRGRSASAPSARPSRKQRFLPELASGERLSAFALTEPGAGSDLTALRTTAALDGDDYVVNGEKLFITNVVPGRTVGLVCLIDRQAGRADRRPARRRRTSNSRSSKYGLYALKHTYNHGIMFNDFRVPAENLLKPPAGDGLTIAYHGLNLGRVALCANAAGTMRMMLANMLPWAKFRKTYGAADRHARAGAAPHRPAGRR